MGELFICNEPIAALPYYIEGISWNVYSIEELCYYIEYNTYLLEKDFMTEELCTWIGKEVKNLKLAERLRDIMRMEGKLSEFVLVLLAECGYCSKEKIKEVVRILQEMEEMSDFECSKLRADRLMEKEKYLSSIYEYRNLLESNEAGEQSRELLGAIWHNLGTAYARLFLFQEAVHGYEKAYAYNANRESLKEALMAYRLMQDEAGFETMVLTYQVSPELVQSIQNEIDLVYGSVEVERFENALKEIAATNIKGQRKKYQTAISDIVYNWKEEYRRICKI
jgi:tetratricopeptide (TPR) repeat protein